ncbi:hypothetical protein GH714_022220 [Hevea brasiliensis]|uniref:SMAX1-like nucleotide binding domain-containing protein n=1 Tax=Hevea brasiliensis TaxID=3981 RepID=A0A6A6MXW1_HEVBR|nr:hypothetical protein GH714_022220 [Hevea brasiliensis]
MGKRIVGELMRGFSEGEESVASWVCSDALNRFIECVNKDGGGILPTEIAGLSLISVEKEIIEFLNEGGNNREKMDFKVEELRHKLEQCSGPGIVLSFGELKALVDEKLSSGALSYLVSKLTGLLEGFKDKLRLMGATAVNETYSKFLGEFPAIEKDWDLHILPITSSKSPIDCFGSKSSLMGSFVPFGGFFSTPSDLKYPLCNVAQSITQCHLCTAKYEQEVTAMLKGSTVSIADQYSENLPSWLQMAQLDTGKGLDVAKGRAQALVLEGFQYVADRKESSSGSCSRDSLINESQCANLSLGVHMDLQNDFPKRNSIPITVDSETENVNCQSKLIKEASKNLGLGTIFASCSRRPNTPKLGDHREHYQHFSGFNSSKFGISESISHQVIQPSSCSNPSSGEHFDSRDYKSIKKALNEKVGWQEDAICAISQAISRCKAGYGRHRGSTVRGDIWLTFVGHDKVGKKKLLPCLLR